MRRYITAAIGLLLILYYCSGCGVNYHLRKAKKHIRKAEALGGKWSSDTLFKKLSFKVPGIKVEFDPKILTSGKPMIFYKDSVRTEVLIVPGQPGKPDSIFVNTDCPPQQITAKVPIAVSNSIKAGRSLFADICIWLLIALGAFTCGYWARDGPKAVKILFDRNEKPPN